jgi:hypothetical protein
MRHELNTRSQQHIAKCSTVDSRRKASRKPWPEICRKEWTNCFVPRSKKCEERHHTASSQWAEFTPTTAKLISINGSFAGSGPIQAHPSHNSGPVSPNKPSHQTMRRLPVGKSGFETATEGHSQPGDAHRRGGWPCRRSEAAVPRKCPRGFSRPAGASCGGPVDLNPVPSSNVLERKYGGRLLGVV